MSSVSKPSILSVTFVVTGVLFAGCLHGGPSTAEIYTVEVSTSYDHARTADEDKDRARDLGFEDGDPATRGDPPLLVQFEGDGSGSSGDAPRCLFPDEDGVVDPARSPPRFCIDLNGTGGAIFRVRVDGPVVLRSIGVDGAAEVGDSCYYGGEVGGAWGIQPNVPIDQDLTFDVPFGIKCRG